MDHQALLDVLGNLPGRRVLVVGDVMLDQYVTGDVERISPEAPVPVVRVKQRRVAPGGAANVAANVAALGGMALLVGVMGADEASAELSQALAGRRLETSGLVVAAESPTTAKLRVMARRQQLIRMDTEACKPFGPEIERDILSRVNERMRSCEVCILSDYNKGAVPEAVARGVIEMAREAGRPVIVDPKGSDPGKYRGATAITPNTAELEALTANRLLNGEPLPAAALLQDCVGSEAVLVTRGSGGMLLVLRDREPCHFPACVSTAVDVTGAGDTAVAVFALAVAAGAPLPLAASVANAAAGVVVGKVGTATVSPGELAAQCAAGRETAAMIQ